MAKRKLRHFPCLFSNGMPPKPIIGFPDEELANHLSRRNSWKHAVEWKPGMIHHAATDLHVISGGVAEHYLKPI